jgi:glyoxylase-like metal-dependent hydrolase (beta-lactamase superfamily II)
MLLKTFVVGPLDTNCYVVASEDSGEALVVDVGAEGERVARELAGLGLHAVALVSTHSHYDHVGGVAALRAAAPLLRGRAASGGPTPPAYALHAADVPALGRGEALREVFSGYQDPPQPERVLHGGEILAVGDVEVHVIHTPGHTPGSICLYVPFPGEGSVFTGDTLFQMSIGRADFAGGDQRQELASIRDVLLALPDATRVFPGHGPPTTIGDERRWNPFLRGL